MRCAPNHLHQSRKCTLTCREQQFPPVLPTLLAKQHPLHHPATHNGEKGWFYRNSQPRSSLLNHLFLCMHQNTVLTALLSCRRLKPKLCIPFQRLCVARALVFETGKRPTVSPKSSDPKPIHRARESTTVRDTRLLQRVKA